MRGVRLVLLFCFFCCSGTEDPGTEDAAGDGIEYVPGRKSLHILFIGNSLTYYNDLPALVAELAAMDGVTVAHKMIAPGGVSLEDHWNNGEATAEIGTGNYDLVVGQQGPSALPESQVLLKQYALKFSEECAAHKTPWALYMVWPSESRSFDLDNVIYSYTQAAKASSATLFAAGLAWKYAWQGDGDLPLYGSDRFHPSVMGSLLAAMTVYAVLQDKKDFDFIERGNASWKEQVAVSELEILKEAALKAKGSRLFNHNLWIAELTRNSEGPQHRTSVSGHVAHSIAGFSCGTLPASRTCRGLRTRLPTFGPFGVLDHILCRPFTPGYSPGTGSLMKHSLVSTSIIDSVPDQPAPVSIIHTSQYFTGRGDDMGVWPMNTSSKDVNLV